MDSPGPHVTKKREIYKAVFSKKNNYCRAYLRWQGKYDIPELSEIGTPSAKRMREFLKRNSMSLLPDVLSILKEQPGSIDLKKIIGRLYIDQGDSTTALRHFQALRDVSDQWIKSNASHLMLDSGDIDDALSFLSIPPPITAIRFVSSQDWCAAQNARRTWVRPSVKSTLVGVAHRFDGLRRPFSAPMIERSPAFVHARNLEIGGLGWIPRTRISAKLHLAINEGHGLPPGAWKAYAHGYQGLIQPEPLNKYINISRPVAFTPYSPWRDDNYYHWMIQKLPVLLALRTHGYGDRLLVVPHGLYKWQYETLDMIGWTEDRRLSVPLGKNLRLGDVVMADCEDTAYAPTATVDRLALRETLLAAFGIRQREPDALVFLARSQARNNRFIINENEVLAVMREFGFSVVNPEALSLKEQAAVIAGARVLCGVVGASLTNLLYCSPRCKVIALSPITCAGPIYLWLSQGLGIEYHKVLCKSATVSPPVTTPIYVDIKMLKTVLKEVLDAGPVHGAA